MRDIFSIFIGGPMGESGKVNPKGEETHIGNIKKAVERITKEIEDQRDDLLFQINTPEVNETGEITQRIFGMIDTADLGIIDISANSPSVMYELAMLHALGIPTIPIQLRDGNGELKNPYYLRGTYTAGVNTFEVDALYDELKEKIQNVTTGESLGSDYSNNPMTEYYGLHMIDVSASTGLATGYVHNFIQHVIKENSKLFQFLGVAEKFITIRPNKLSEVNNIRSNIQQKLFAKGIDIEKADQDGKVYKDGDHPRGQMTIDKAGRYLFDVPTPLNAQRFSPRYKQLANVKISTASLGAIRDEAESRVNKYETQMITQFMHTVKWLIKTYPNINPNYHVIMSEDEFVNLVISENDDG